MASSRLSLLSLPLQRYTSNFSVSIARQALFHTTSNKSLRSRIPKTVPAEKPLPVTRSLSKFESVLGFLDNRLGITFGQKYRGHDLNVASQTLLNGIYMKVDFGTIQQTGKLEDSFPSWLSVIYLHVWMLFVRLKQEGRDGRMMIKMITATLWEDIEKRAKKIEDELQQDLAVKKQMRDYVSLLQTSFMFYDEGLMKCDATLASSIWMQMFNSDEDTDIQSIEAFVHYIRYSVARLDGIPMERLVFDSDNIKWPLPNSFGSYT